MTMAAVLAEKFVSQLSISFPEAAILLYNDGDHYYCPIRCIKVAGALGTRLHLYTAVCCPTPDRPVIIQK